MLRDTQDTFGSLSGMDNIGSLSADDRIACQDALAEAQRAIGR
jgi:hypothetical protein